jgi:hypothetical protein
MDYGCVPAYHDPADADAEETVAVLECENSRKACEKLHHVPEFDYMGCDDCMEEAMAELSRESAELEEVA